MIDLYSKEYNFEAVIPISAYQPKYKEIILDEIEKNLKTRSCILWCRGIYRSNNETTSRRNNQRKSTKTITRWSTTWNICRSRKNDNEKKQNGEDIYDIEATIYCLRESHKGIIIGKNGEMLKKIGRAARIDMEQNFGLKVNLKHG